MDKFIQKLQTIACHTLLNKDQKNRFIEAEVHRFVSQLNEDELPALRASVRLAREETFRNGI